MSGSEPPNSSVTRLMVSAAPRITRRPVSVEPVKPTLATSGWVTSAVPTSAPVPRTVFTTFAGTPASCRISMTAVDVNGVVSAGFTTMVFPVTRAGPILLPSSESGKFHGMMAAQTPSGRFRMIPWRCGFSSRSGT